MSEKTDIALNQLAQYQGMPLWNAKIRRTEFLIRQWYEAFDGQVYVAYSGGLDSTVLLDLVRSVYPDIPAVFADTGQEFESIYEQVNATANVTTINPAMTFEEILKKYGYPVISKKLCRFIQDVQNPTARNENTRRLRMTGIDKNGDYKPRWMIPKKWRFLLDAPFKMTNKCCGILKIDPTKPYQKKNRARSVRRCYGRGERGPAISVRPRRRVQRI